jgi:hypothetical protein
MLAREAIRYRRPEKRPSLEHFLIGSTDLCPSARCRTRLRDAYPFGTDIPPGQFRSVDLNARGVPVEFPAGSGALLESGNLLLEPSGRFIFGS